MQSLITYFEDNKQWATALVLVVLLVLFGLLLLARKLFGRGVKTSGSGRTRQPRLGIVDAFDLDRHRQLVLLRRDNIEHLVMIGGPNDVLIESSIVRAQSLAPIAGNRENAGPLGGATSGMSAVAAAVTQPTPPLVAPPIAASMPGAPSLSAPATDMGGAPPPLDGPPPLERAKPAPAATRPAGPSARPEDAATGRALTEGETDPSRPVPARPTTLPPRPAGLPPRPAAAAMPPRPTTLPPRPAGLPPRPNPAAPLPPRPLRPVGPQPVPRADPPQTGEAPPIDAPAPRVEPEPAAAPPVVVAPPLPPQPQPPKNLDTLESLEEEMAKLLGRPAPKRDE